MMRREAAVRGRGDCGVQAMWHAEALVPSRRTQKNVHIAALKSLCLTKIEQADLFGGMPTACAPMAAARRSRDGWSRGSKPFLA